MTCLDIIKSGNYDNQKLIDKFFYEFTILLNYVTEQNNKEYNKFYLNQFPIVELIKNDEYIKTIMDILDPGVNHQYLSQDTFLKKVISFYNDQPDAPKINLFNAIKNSLYKYSIKKRDVAFLSIKMLFPSIIGLTIDDVYTFLTINNDDNKDKNLYYIALEYLTAYREKKYLTENGYEAFFTFVSDYTNEVGYDILSYDINTNQPKLIEVKCSTDDSGYIYITPNELNIAKKYSDNYYIYFYNVKENGTTRLFELKYNKEKNCFINTINNEELYFHYGKDKSGNERYIIFYDQIFNPCPMYYVTPPSKYFNSLNHCPCKRIFNYKEEMYDILSEEGVRTDHYTKKITI